jgi:hypothetical protein
MAINLTNKEKELLIKTFVESDPLKIPMLVACDMAREKGTKIKTIVKEFFKLPEMKLWMKLLDGGVIESDWKSKKEVTEFLEEELRKRKKYR